MNIWKKLEKYKTIKFWKKGKIKNTQKNKFWKKGKIHNNEILKTKKIKLKKWKFEKKGKNKEKNTIMKVPKKWN